MSKQYPIGTFDGSLSYSWDILPHWIEDIELLPGKLSAELTECSDNLLDTPYRKNGWTVRQVVHHLADSHLNAFVRYKLALTENNPIIKPYNEQAWALLADYKQMPVEDILTFIYLLHKKWVIVLKHMSPKDFRKTLVHPEPGNNYPPDLFRITGMYAWHGNHHLAHIKLVTQNQ